MVQTSKSTSQSPAVLKKHLASDDPEKGSNWINFVTDSAERNGMSVRDKLREKVSVFEFMSKEKMNSVIGGAGNMDVSAELNNAYSSGEAIFLPEGIYFIDSPLIFSEYNFYLYGKRKQRTVIKASSNITDTIIKIEKEGTALLTGTLENLTISGNVVEFKGDRTYTNFDGALVGWQESTYSANNAIEISGYGNVIINSVDTNYLNRVGIYLKRLTKNTIIYNSKASYCKKAGLEISGQGTYNTKIKHCGTYRTKEGIIIYDTNSVSVSSSSFVESNETPLVISDSSNVSIDNSVFKKTGQASNNSAFISIKNGSHSSNTTKTFAHIKSCMFLNGDTQKRSVFLIENASGVIENCETEKAENTKIAHWIDFKGEQKSNVEEKGINYINVSGANYVGGAANVIPAIYLKNTKNTWVGYISSEPDALTSTIPMDRSKSFFYYEKRGNIITLYFSVSDVNLENVDDDKSIYLKGFFFTSIENGVFLSSDIEIKDIILEGYTIKAIIENDSRETIKFIKVKNNQAENITCGDVDVNKIYISGAITYITDQ